MIKNSKELNKAKENLAGFKRALNELREKKNELHPFEFAANENASLDLIKNTEEEIREFENLRDGDACIINLESIHELGELLIRTRIAHGWSQELLAEKLGLNQQQVHRWESRNYESITWFTMRDVIDALGINLHSNNIFIKQPKFDQPEYFSAEQIQEACSKVRQRKQLLVIEEN